VNPIYYNVVSSKLGKRLFVGIRKDCETFIATHSLRVLLVREETLTIIVE